MKKFYATDYMLLEILVFESRKERNAWVNFKDEFSQWYPPEDGDLKRIPLTHSEAVSLIGKDKLHNPNELIKGEWMGEYKVITVKPLCDSLMNKIRFAMMRRDFVI